MTLRRRLLTYLLLCAPLVWALAFAISFDRARDEVDELYDTELIRLARQVQALLPADGSAADVSFGPLPPVPAEGDAGGGAGDARSLATAVWDRSGRRVVDHDAATLRYRPGQAGFVDEVIDGIAWRVYYLPSASGAWVAAAGQRAYERSELVYDVTLSQLVPWIVMLPVLLAAMALAVRRALEPIQHLARHLGERAAEDLSPIPADRQPGELRPVVAAMNGLFQRVADALAHERRFTADAAHEIRTPLAALRAQWDVVRRSAGPERVLAEARLSAGLDRMDRAVTQLLLLSRVDAVRPGTEAAARQDEIDWHAVVEEVVADCLPLAERRQVDISCEWPSDDRRAFPLLGNQALLALMLRNLLDNAVRYATPRSAVALRFSETTLTVTNDSPPIAAERMARLGERFYRIEGQDEPGSGLGISIARRIALLHGLEIAFSANAARPGEFRATVRFAGTATLAPFPVQATPRQRLTPLEAAP